ncbi:hypothetical protein [Leptospira sarikeiensis]|uniref:Uncharacterized protein n=1 Tax=Leptospira sarikeiensis TaxID=2484943 RepID=A0A4R9K8X7_9LEPT|nr:hypothetical protein [Leptospira sarikeiensis]TGL61168.1 hypothetical protein EHQ64_11160 [Leptospira sarikeiensis]
MHFLVACLPFIAIRNYRGIFLILTLAVSLSCSSLESIKSKPVSPSCPNFGILNLSEVNSEILYTNNLFPLESSLVKIKGDKPPYFYGEDLKHYLNNKWEFIALPDGKVIEKQYATNALDIDDWDKIAYFKHLYFKVCPKENEIPFFSKIKVIKEDEETKAKVVREVKQKGIQSLIGLISKAKTSTELKRYYWILNMILDEKASIYLKKNFPKYSKYADYKITWSDGEDSGYQFKDLFRLCLNKNPHTGAAFDKTGFFIKGGDTAQELEIHMKKKDTGETDIFGPEFFFRINEDYITLTGLKQWNVRNAKAWEPIASEAIRLFSNQVNIGSFDFDFLNKDLIDSLK